MDDPGSFFGDELVIVHLRSYLLFTVEKTNGELIGTISEASGFLPMFL